jgi:predicted nucleotide-binding protein
LFPVWGGAVHQVQLIALTGSGSPYIGQVLEQAFQQVQAVVAFFTPDERVCGRGGLEPRQSWRLQPRPNVLIEAGMAMVTHPDQAIFVVLGEIELPSDLAGRAYIRPNGTSEPLSALATRLEHAGCEIDRTGAHWLDGSRFPKRVNIPMSPQG